MITEFLEILFRPKAEMTNAQIRKTGAVLALISIVIFGITFTLMFLSVQEGGTPLPPFFSIPLFFILVFYGLGLHRVIWGNISSESLYMIWGKGLISIVATIGSIMVIAFCGGLIFALIKG